MRKNIEEWMENIPGGMIIFRADDSSEIVYANRRAMEIYGCFSMEELLKLTGKSFIGGILEEDRYRAEKAIWGQIDTGKRNYDHVVFRVHTKNGTMRQLDAFGRLMDDPDFGFVFCVFLADNDHVLGGYQARRAAFEHFMCEGETNGKNLPEPGYKGYLYFNLSKSAPVLKYDGIRYIPAGKEKTYTYDDHFEFVTSRMFNDEDRRTAQKFSRNRLLTYYQSGKRTLQTNLRYLCRGGWVNIHTDFTMTENPDTGDVIVLVQNENNSTEMLFERIIGTVISDLFEKLIYIDGPADVVLVEDHRGEEPVRVKASFRASTRRICLETGLSEEKPEDFLATLGNVTADEEKVGWTFRKDGRIKLAQLREPYRGSGQFFILLNDITEQVEEYMDRSETNSPESEKSSALAHEYFTVIEIDVKERKIKPYKIYANSPQILVDLVNEGDYDKVCRAFTRYMVSGRYQKTFAKYSQLDYMAKRLSEIPTYDYIFESSSGFFTKFRAVRMKEINGEVTRMIVGFSDCDQEVRNYNKVYQESMTDELTGLNNRFGLREDFNGFPGRTLVIGRFDIDEFRRINDQCGHDAGDAALRDYAQLLRRSFQDMNIYRYGSDEFLIIGDYLPGAFEQSIAAYQSGLESMTVLGTEQKMSASVGYVTAYCESNEMLRHMLRASGQNLQKVKNNGKRGIFGCIYREEN
ncbi:sensor domain-containing diguanylate cyclase [[Clostridium] aminophilum]|uniref:sensor domain-containing diguanylate cyclase n=1 Tax=[Clostridium] aminophilum TaxID=1526 RepID=UPI003327CFB9